MTPTWSHVAAVVSAKMSVRFLNASRWCMNPTSTIIQANTITGNGTGTAIWRAASTVEKGGVGRSHGFYEIGGYEKEFEQTGVAGDD